MRWVALTLVSAALAASACSRSDAERTASGLVDAAAANTMDVVAAAAPGVQITRTDGRSLRKATMFRLTPTNLEAFMRAAESLAALERNDSTVRAYLNVTVSDAGALDAEAGRRWLEANPKVHGAITSSGLSVQNYYVAAIAIAAAEQFLNHPKTVPVTPPLARNALLMQQHGRDLVRLRQLRRTP
jgi:hypothetical protein